MVSDAGIPRKYRLRFDSSPAARAHPWDYLRPLRAPAHLGCQRTGIAGWRLGLSEDLDGASSPDGFVRDGALALSDPRSDSNTQDRTPLAFDRACSVLPDAGLPQGW